MCIRDRGLGVWPPEHVEEILDARSRAAAGPTAVARGLTLISLEEETELRPVIAAENKEWKYSLDQSGTVAEKQSFLTIEPVSYTHLDVYKRQGF